MPNRPDSIFAVRRLAEIYDLLGGERGAARRWNWPDRGRGDDGPFGTMLLILSFTEPELG
jgi:hypothetical protein